MALNLGAMIQSARTQQNPLGDAIANYQNQEDRGLAKQQMAFNNLSSILGAMNGGQMGGLNLDQNKMLADMGLAKYLAGGV